MSTTRNADLNDLVTMLKDQHARKVDVVAPATSIRSENARLVIEGTAPVLDESGVTMGDGTYLPTTVCDEGIAEKLKIPLLYVRRMRAERPDLYDANVNGWLHGTTVRHATFGAPAAEPDTRSFLVRCFRGDGEVGVARALLSDSYKMMDNLDVLMSALEGIEEAGVNVDIEGCDLTDRRMYVRVVAPEVQVLAETLLKGYRNPFGAPAEDDSAPIVFAGFVVSNSEVGGGAFSVTPRAVVLRCKNGMTFTKDMMRSVHLGGKLDEGIIDWSADTQEQAVRLVKSKTRDAVRTFLDPMYLARIIHAMEQKSEQPVATVDEVKVLTKPLRFTPEQMDGILGRFVQGGQMTRGGVMNAITAHAQEVSDADVAHAMEAQAVGLLV